MPCSPTIHLVWEGRVEKSDHLRCTAILQHRRASPDYSGWRSVSCLEEGACACVHVCVCKRKGEGGLQFKAWLNHQYVLLGWHKISTVGNFWHKSLDYHLLIKILRSFLRGKTIDWSLQWFCIVIATFRQVISSPVCLSPHHSLLPQIQYVLFHYLPGYNRQLSLWALI